MHGEAFDLSTPSRVGALCVVWATLLMCDTLRGDGVVRDGLGATSSGRGGTNLGHSDTGAILLDNPAGMVNIEGQNLFEFSNALLLTDLDYSDVENSTNAKFRPSYLPQLSYIRRAEGGSWAAGVGFFAPAGFGAQWSLTNPLFGRRGYKSLGALMKVMPAAALALTDRLSIGGALGVGISHAELESPFFLQTGPLRGVPTLFDLQATGAAPAWNLGLQYELNDSTTLGFAYTAETRFRMDGNLDVEVMGLAPAPLHSDFDAQLDIVWPRSLGVGVKHGGPNERVSADVIWYDWSHAFNDFDLELTGATNPLFTALVGPKIRDTFPLDWRDSVSWRFGYERFLTDSDVVRAGYTYHPNPIPGSTLTPLIPAILEHAFSAGYGKQWGSCRFDLSYQFSFGPEQDTSISRVVGGDFNFAEVKAQAHWVLASFSYTY